MIIFDQIDINYGEKNILVNSRLELKQGRFYCFIGKNGSGKTSLFNYMKSNKQHNYNIRMLQQNHEMKSHYEITVWDFLKSFCKFESLIQWKNLIDSYLIKFELEDKRFQLINNLSGGEKQRLFLIQILLGSSDLLLLDESFSNLDIEHKIKYYELLKNEAERRNIPIVLIEHDLRFALEFSTNIIFCITKTCEIRNYKSGTEELNRMINQEYNIEITPENKYHRLLKD